MKTLKKVPVIPVYVKFIPPVEEMEEGKVYISLEFNTVIHRCMCGCGEQTVTPINKPHGWSFEDRNGKITLSPSIGNYQLPCKSHYIIQNGNANFV